MLWTRIISAVIGIPIILGLVYLGGAYFLIGIVVLAILAMVEMRRMLIRMGRQDMPVFLWVGAILFPVLLYFQPIWLPSFTAFFVLSGGLVCLGQYPRITFQDIGANFFGILYVAFGFAHFILLRESEQGLQLVMYALIVIWCTDSGAYFIGKNFGRRPFFHRISPKKTWEGAIGGLASGVLGAVIFCYAASRYQASFDHPALMLWASPFLSIAGQLGDLFESALKRQARLKDSSRIIPGHGGILDRFDSALWVMPLLYHWILLYHTVFAG